MNIVNSSADFCEYIESADLKDYIHKNNLLESFVCRNLLISSSRLMSMAWRDAPGVRRVNEETVPAPVGTFGKGLVVSLIDLPNFNWHHVCQRTDLVSVKEKTVSIFVKSIECEGSKDFVISINGGLPIAVFSRENYEFISGIASSVSVESHPHGWCRISATYCMNNQSICFGTSDGSNARYKGENMRQFYICGPQLEYGSSLNGYSVNSRKSRVEEIIPRKNITKDAVFDAVKACHSKHPLKKVVILSDGHVDLSPFACVRCDNTNTDAMNEYDFSDTVFIYACDSDVLGLPFIKKIVDSHGVFLPVVAGNPSLYTNVNEPARCMLEDEFRIQIAEGFAKWDYGPYDFINIVQAIDITSQLSGDYVEIGCFNGSSSRIAARYMYERGIKRNCYFFDVFDGFNYDAARCSSDNFWVGSHVTDGIDKVKQRLCKYHAPDLGLFIHVEKHNIIESELPSTIENIVVANIDVDLYEAVKSALFKICYRVVRGGIIIVEDAGHTPLLIGARLALKEFMDSDCGSSFIPVYMQSGQTFLIRA